MVVTLSLGLAGFFMVTALKTISSVLVRNGLETARREAEQLAVAASPYLEAGLTPHSKAYLTQAGENLAQTTGIVYVACTDREGRVIASAVAPHAPRQADSLLFENDHLPQEDLEQAPWVRRWGNRGIYVDAVQPIVARTTGDDVLGYVRLVTNLSVAKAEVAAITNRLHAITVVLLALVIPGSLLLTRRLVAPLHELARAARALANGVMDARVPVRSKDEIGQLANSFNMMASRVTQSQMELLQLAAELEARVQERTRELQELASKDALTGLYNRRHFAEVMEREFAAAERYHSDLTCLMFDLDHFKQINDRFGHAAGDDALVLLAEAIRSQLRTADIAARFGGDEFILLLPRTSSRAGRSLAERIQKEFATRVHHKYPEMPASLSIGIASLRGTRTPSAEALVNKADLAMYAAKATARGTMMEATPTMQNPPRRSTPTYT